MKKITLLLFAICLFSYLGAQNQVTVIGANGITDNTSYPRLKEAFDAINLQSNQAEKNIEIQISGNTTETESAILNQGSWNSLTIYPTAENVTIGGDLASDLIDLNGADKVTITGKLNKTGISKNLTIENTKSDNLAHAIRMINDATFNTITHCKIKGSCPHASSGVVFISTTTGTTGNDDNTISYNDLNKSGTASPYSVVYAAGTATKTNDRLTIDNNHFFNLYSGTTFYAMRIGANNSEFTITNNNIYEPNEVIPTAAQSFYGISITGIGEKFTISNNYIGGSGAGCTGLFKKSNDFSNDFNGIIVSTGTSATNATSVQGNVIKNIEWKNADVKKDFTSMQTFGNAVNVGTSVGNTISDIIWENGVVSGGVFYGVNMQNTGGTNVAENNTISNISINSTDAAHGSNFYGLFKSNSAGAVTFRNNTLTGINLSGTSNANGQVVAGVHLNYVSGTVRAYTYDIIGNTIYNINNASSRTDIGNSVYGIFVNPPQGSGTIANNKIYNITASNPTLPARVIGINLDVTSATTATICANNMITLGNSNPGLVYGILQNTGLGKVYQNSVYLAGSPAEGSFESSALNITGTTAGREFLNNILYNTRSNTGTADSKHYIVKMNATTNLTSDYNVVNYTGTGGLLGAIGATDYTTANDWISTTGLDTHSKATTVNFIDTAAGDLKITGDSQQDGYLAVPKLDAVSSDMFGTTRGATTYAGAHESTLPFIFTSTVNPTERISIRTTKTGIEVTLSNESVIELYNANGVLIEKTRTNGMYSRSLNNGVYIININGKATKFVR